MCYFIFSIVLLSLDLYCGLMIPEEREITTAITVLTKQPQLQEEELVENNNANTNEVENQVQTFMRQDYIPQTSAYLTENSHSAPNTNVQVDYYDVITVDKGIVAQPCPDSISNSNINNEFGINSNSVDDDKNQFQQLSDLLGTILSDYNPRFRPIQDQLRSVVIRSDFVPINIIDFDTQEQRFSVMGYFRLEWKDDFLTWAPSTYGDTRYLRIPVENVWTPKLTYSKARYGNGLVGHKTSDVALLHYSGIIQWFPEGTYDLACGVDITFYPFDTQTCSLSYYIGDEDRSTVDLQLSGEADLSEYIENAEWKLLNLTAEQKIIDNVYTVQYNFTVERRAGFALFTMMVPLSMLSALSGTTFLIPIDSGEKCCFAVTVFLSYGIFETIVIETLPQNSLSISYIVIYITFLLACSSLLVFYTIVQARIMAGMGHRNVPEMRCINSGRTTTFLMSMSKVDSTVFILYMAVVIGVTSMFVIIMSNRKENLLGFLT